MTNMSAMKKKQKTMSLLEKNSVLVGSSVVLHEPSQLTETKKEKKKTNLLTTCLR